MKPRKTILYILKKLTGTATIIRPEHTRYIEAVRTPQAYYKHPILIPRSEAIRSHRCAGNLITGPRLIRSTRFNRGAPVPSAASSNPETASRSDLMESCHYFSPEIGKD